MSSATDTRKQVFLDSEPPQGIQSLPSELICVIFSFIHTSSILVSSDRKCCAQSPALAQYITHLSEMWTDIRLFHCRPGHVDMLDEYFRRSNDLRLDILLDVPFNATELTQFWGIVLKIWSVAQRWRRLCIITTGNNFSVVQNNVGRKTPAWLESLELRVCESESSYNLPVLRFGSMPSLKSLVLHGIALEISDTSSFFDQLENLDLFATPAALPLCRLLSTPLLEELSINDLSGACWQTFTLALRDECLEFPALRTLKLSFIAQCQMHGHLDIAFPALEHLSLFHVDCSTFFSALSKPGSALWPHLHSLALDNADYRVLCSVVEARIAMGYPLATLEVDSPQFIDTSSLQWLQKHVKTLKRNLPA
ncbi:hypothetical protein B0H13DRAFT_2508597 [Mycena leptocephala]|nr:hypothetical protein B0H13DRAFT_2508597 [Mycena leptocephala]